MNEKFKSLEEFNKFCDESMFCVCGRLMTGLHMSGCRRLWGIRIKLVEEKMKGEATTARGEGIGRG